MSTPSKLRKRGKNTEDLSRQESNTTPRRRSAKRGANEGTSRQEEGEPSQGSSQDIIPPSQDIPGSSQDIFPSSPGSIRPLTPSQGDPLGSQRDPTTPSRDDFFPSQIGSMEYSSPLRYGSPSSRGDRRSQRSVQNTPMRQRADIQKGNRAINVVVNETQSQESAGGSQVDGEAVIWGTDVSVEKCKRLFKEFISTYVEEAADSDERFNGLDAHLPIYLQRLDEINLVGEPFLNFNCDHLKKFNANLYRQLLVYPQEVIPTFDVATNEIYFNKYPESSLEHQIQVRPYNAASPKSMRSLNPEDIDQLISVSGMVIRTSSLIPEMREAYFECNICCKGEVVEIERGRIVEPTLCRHCNTSHSYQLVHNRSLFTDKQLVKLQESPEDMPTGQTPHTMVIFAHGDLVDKVQPGDRITVTGIYRATPLRINPRQRNVLAVYKTHFDVVHYRKVNHKRLHETAAAHNDEAEEDGKEMHLSQEKVESLKELSKSPGIYEALASAIAPSIYENLDVKKGILLQLFSGARKEFSASGRGRFRSDINILLCGDPGTSKSQLLQYVYALVPRGQYTSGKGSSAVGLTAYVTKDPETKQLVLQTGALVLSDNGVCCIDEFDKMNESTRSVLHEVMEQQTLSIAKAGIICTLNARTSVLAAANPIESKWNKNKNIIENIQLPHTLLSRFDLIFLILDPQDEVFDRKLAYHLISLYYKADEVQESNTLDLDTLKDYIGYARTHVHPVISDEAGQLLVESYVEMRKIGTGRGQVSAYPRQLESLIRLAEAHARMRLSNEVIVEDVKEARRLHREALKQAAIDPSTGKIDVSILTTGITGAARKLRATRASQLLAIMKAKGRVLSFKYNQLFDEFKEKLVEGGETFVTYETFDNALRDLQDDNEIVRTGSNIRRTNP